MSGSDAARRKTLWNQELIRQGLAPLLDQLYLAIADHLRQLCLDEPKLYLSLIPPVPTQGDPHASLAAHLSHSYYERKAQVRVYDLWGAPLDLAAGSGDGDILLESVPDWLAAYKAEFRDLSKESYRYVSESLGKALAEALKCKVRKGPRPFTAREILKAPNAPREEDIVPLLNALKTLDEETLKDCWALLKAEEGEPVRYAADAVYLLTSKEQPLPPPLKAVLAAGMGFSSNVVFVRAGTGLNDPRLKQPTAVGNLHRAAKAIFEALSRLNRADDHDACPSLSAASPVVDFLVRQTPARTPNSLHLAWLVRTADGQEGLRGAGLVMVQPGDEDKDAQILWKGFLQETFAQVDPKESRKFVARLLDAGFGEFLSSADQVQVATPTAGRILPLLFRAVARDPGLLQRMETALNGSPSADGKIRSEALGSSSLLLQEADKQWDNLSDAEKQLVLRLPIHRNSRNQFIALLQTGQREKWVTEISNLYRLQGDGKDLRDAPVDLPDDVVLLHSQEKSAYEFYRTRLGLRPHGRVWVLKDCLRQIGQSGLRDSTLFHYLCGYLKQQLDDLAESADPADRQDHDELQQLLDESLIVPTATGSWCRLRDAVDASDCRKRLKKAGYQGRSLDDLLVGLFHPHAVADAVHTRELKMLPESPREAGLDEAAHGALRSASPDLSLRDRVRVILALREELEDSARGSDHVRNTVEVSVGGDKRGPLGSARLPEQGTLPVATQRRLLPEIVNLEALSNEWGLPQAEIQKALARLGVEMVTDEQLKAALLDQFPRLWPGLDQKDRLSVLGYLAQADSRGSLFSSVCASLPVVLCEDGQWRSPEDVIPPCWRSLRPPESLWNTAADHAKVKEETAQLWDAWSPYRY